MKKSLLVVWCLVVASQGLVGMSDYKKRMKEKYKERKNNDNQAKNDNDFLNESESNSFNGKKSTRGTANRPARISDFDCDEDEKKRALTHHHASEEYKKKLAEENGFNNINDYIAYESFEQQNYLKAHSDRSAKKKGFKSYNELVGKEHAEQQFYAQKELKKIKKENRSASSLALDIQDAFWDRSIELTAGAAAELVVGTFVVPHLQDAARSLRGLLYPSRVKEEKKLQLVEQVMQQEELFVGAEEKTASVITNTNKRLGEILNTIDCELDQRGISQSVQKAFKKDIAEMNQELQEMISSAKVKTKADILEFQNKFKLLPQKHKITDEDFELILRRDQIAKDLEIGIQQEVDALKNLVALNINVRDRVANNYANTFQVLEAEQEQERQREAKRNYEEALKRAKQEEKNNKKILDRQRWQEIRASNTKNSDSSEGSSMWDRRF